MRWSVIRTPEHLGGEACQSMAHQTWETSSVFQSKLDEPDEEQPELNQCVCLSVHPSIKQHLAASQCQFLLLLDSSSQLLLWKIAQNRRFNMTSKLVIQQPQTLGMATTSNQWSSGICDCTKDLPSCCFAFWCFPCFSCVTAKEAGECLCLPLLDYFGPIPPATMSMRASLRQRYGIEGTLCNDCVFSFFCMACTWCQMSREMKTRVQPITLINTRAH